MTRRKASGKQTVGRAAPGKQYPGLHGKVVDYVDTAEEEGRLYIHIRFTDETELCFDLSCRIVIDEADLSDWKTGNRIEKRVYMRSPEFAEIAAQEPEFQRICRQLDREARQKGRKK